MHAEAWAWLVKQADDVRPAVGSVMDLGGRDINGSPRGLFPGVPYVVVDLYPGPGVDVVCDARDFIPADPVDLVICAEVLEHVDDVPGILAAAGRWLTPGGTLLLTAAADPREPHSHHDGGPVRAGEHYANVNPDELEQLLEAGPWHPPTVLDHDQVHGDVYCRAVRA